jgi:hypothetical protein
VKRVPPMMDGFQFLDMDWEIQRSFAAMEGSE